MILRFENDFLNYENGFNGGGQCALTWNYVTEFQDSAQRTCKFVLALGSWFPSTRRYLCISQELLVDLTLDHVFLSVTFFRFIIKFWSFETLIKI